MANISKKAREDRAQKEADEILKRSDDDYLEIEQFKEYEFSWCIAFEMAKRDAELRKDTQRFIKFYKRHKIKIDFIPFSVETFEKDFNYRLHRRAKVIFEYGYDYFAQKYWLIPIDLYYVTQDEIALKMAEVYVHQFHHIEEEMPNERFSLEDEDGILIYAPFEQFGAIQKYLEENNLEILSSGFERIPTTTTKLSEEQQADVEKLLEKLEEDDDVQNVYHSMEM